METNLISEKEFYNKAMQEKENKKVESITITTKDGTKYVYDRKYLQYLMEDIENGAATLTSEGIQFTEALKVLFS